LYEQWEEDEEPLPVDELPEWDPRKPQPQVDLNNFKDPEELLKLSKKGKSLMIFVKVVTTSEQNVVVYYDQLNVCLF
jgi:hypothetical protein